MLQWVGNPDAAIAEARRVLKTDGLFSFTSLGPDSLRELREAWAESDGYQHVHAFLDMHDLGDALVRAGFAEPVMDTERLTITYRNWPALLAELRGSGSTNIAYGRSRSLAGRAGAERAQYSLESLRRNNVLPTTLEIVYGHAWAGALRRRGRADGEVRIPLESLTRRQR
jgi:malonyl-CoA O-methyltransferase